MATLSVCDDCLTEIDYGKNRISINVSVKRLYTQIELCYSCFKNHWKPKNKKFALQNKEDV